MVFHPIARLKQAGIEDILVVTGRDHIGDVMELLGSGHDFGLDFTYKVQDQSGGIAQALGLARQPGTVCGFVVSEVVVRQSLERFGEYVGVTSIRSQV